MMSASREQTGVYSNPQLDWIAQLKRELTEKNTQLVACETLCAMLLAALIEQGETHGENHV